MIGQIIVYRKRLKNNDYEHFEDFVNRVTETSNNLNENNEYILTKRKLINISYTDTHAVIVFEVIDL